MATNKKTLRDNIIYIAAGAALGMILALFLFIRVLQSDFTLLCLALVVLQGVVQRISGQGKVTLICAGFCMGTILAYALGGSTVFVLSIAIALSCAGAVLMAALERGR
ncbi:MAG: hypothetical protein JW942_07005 [Opitutales bacterium]|nr:hypothetical protein [Opitutales bacterium]